MVQVFLYEKQNLAKSILSYQSQFDQSIWLTKSIWPVTFKTICVSPLIFKIISARWRHLVLRNVTWGKCTSSWKGYLWSYTTTMLIILCWWCGRSHLVVRWKMHDDFGFELKVATFAFHVVYTALFPLKGTSKWYQ